MMSPYNFFVHHPIWCLFWMVVITAVMCIVSALLIWSRIVRCERQISELHDKYQQEIKRLDEDIDLVSNKAWDAHDVATMCDIRVKTNEMIEEDARKDEEAKNQAQTAFNQLDEPV